MKHLLLKRGRRRFLIVLAVFLVILAVLAAFRTERLENNGTEEHYTHRGEIRQYHLDDGSALQLGTESRAVVAYDNDIRAVRLISGRARFAVTRPDKNQDPRPFRVLAHNVTVEAPAGSFVMDVTNDMVSVCPLDQGISARANGRTERIGPGQRLNISPSGGVNILQQKLTDTDWLSGTLVLSHVPLSGAVEMINSYRATPIILMNSEKQNVIIDRVLDLEQLDNEVDSLMREQGLIREKFSGSDVYR